jgi:hypothetical protein
MEIPASLRNEMIGQMNSFLEEDEPNPKVVQQAEKEKSKAQAVLDKHDADILKKIAKEEEAEAKRAAPPLNPPVDAERRWDAYNERKSNPLGGSRLYAEQLFKFYKLGSCAVQGAYPNRIDELPAYIEADKDDYISTIERILIKRGITYRMPDEMYLGVLCAKNVTEATVRKMSIHQRELLKNIMTNEDALRQPGDLKGAQPSLVDFDSMFD